jgi:hypothetical protein
VQVGSPNYTHTNNTNMLTLLSKRSPNSPFYTPFPSHISHRHPDKYSPNRTTVIPSSLPPNTLETGKLRLSCREGEGEPYKNSMAHNDLPPIEPPMSPLPTAPITVPNWASCATLCRCKRSPVRVDNNNTNNTKTRGGRAAFLCKKQTIVRVFLI